MGFVAAWCDVIRWTGAGYLVWLGLTRLRAAWRQFPGETQDSLPAGHERWVWPGLAIALSNPKMLLFLGAFVTQFVDPVGAVAPQVAILAITFVVVIVLTDALMALAADSAQGFFRSRTRGLDGGSGGALFCGALWLATTRHAG